MAIIGSLFGGYIAVNVEFRGFVHHICHAFGVSHPTFNNIIHRFIKSGYTMKRKTEKILVRQYSIAIEKERPDLQLLMHSKRGNTINSEKQPISFLNRC